MNNILDCQKNNYCTVYGMRIEDIISMANVIRNNGYDTNSQDWDAFKAGYNYAYNEILRTCNKNIENIFEEIK